MVKISSHLSSQLKLNGKSLKKEEKKNLFKSVSSSPSIHISRLQEPVLSSANGEVGGGPCAGGAGRVKATNFSPGCFELVAAQASWWLRRLAGTGALHYLLGLFLPHAALGDGLEQPGGRRTG